MGSPCVCVETFVNRRVCVCVTVFSEKRLGGERGVAEMDRATSRRPPPPKKREEEMPARNVYATAFLKTNQNNIFCIDTKVVYIPHFSIAPRL